MRRWLRIVKHRLAIYFEKDNIVYNDVPIKGSVPQEWLSDSIMEEDLVFYNLGYKQKYRGF